MIEYPEPPPAEVKLDEGVDVEGPSDEDQDGNAEPAERDV